MVDLFLKSNFILLIIAGQNIVFVKKKKNKKVNFRVFAYTLIDIFLDLLCFHMENN